MIKSEHTANETAIAIQAEKLSFCFGPVKALDNFDIQVNHGSICGLIGQNGAGKTTALHALLGFLPSSNQGISILGLSPDKNRPEILKRVGFYPERAEPYHWLKVKDLFRLGVHAYPTWSKDTCNDLCRRFDLDTSKTMKELTKGMLAKAKLIYALSHQPKCLFLDEPISGLDPASRDELLGIIRDLSQEQGVTTLISSHSLYELADVATEICIIHQGRNLLSASMEQIKNRFTFLEIRRPGVNVSPSLKDLIVLSKTNASITQFLIKDKHHSLLQDLVKPFRPEDVTMRGLSLKELFLFLTKDQIIS